MYHLMLDSALYWRREMLANWQHWNTRPIFIHLLSISRYFSDVNKYPDCRKHTMKYLEASGSDECKLPSNGSQCVREGVWEGVYAFRKYKSTKKREKERSKRGKMLIMSESAWKIYRVLFLLFLTLQLFCKFEII